MQEVYDFLKKVGTYYLATVEDDKPKVRPFGTVDIFENKLYIQTGKVKAVSKQIHKNPNVEICAFDGNKWLRLAGELVEDERREAKKHIIATMFTANIFSFIVSFKGIKKLCNNRRIIEDLNNKKKQSQEEIDVLERKKEILCQE